MSIVVMVCWSARRPKATAQMAECVGTEYWDVCAALARRTCVRSACVRDDPYGNGSPHQLFFEALSFGAMLDGVEAESTREGKTNGLKGLQMQKLI